MAENSIQETLISHLLDALAMEHAVLNVLDGMIIHTADTQFKQLLRSHRIQSQLHSQRIDRRVRELGAAKPIANEIAADASSWLTSFGHGPRGDEPMKNLRDAYLIEHWQIAIYELLERIASRAGDSESVNIVRLNKQDEYEMSRRLTDLWGRSVELALADEPAAAVEDSSIADGRASWGSSADADMGLGFGTARTTGAIHPANLRLDIQRKRNPF